MMEKPEERLCLSPHGAVFPVVYLLLDSALEFVLSQLAFGYQILLHAWPRACHLPWSSSSPQGQPCVRIKRSVQAPGIKGFLAADPVLEAQPQC